ncbi:toll/interleukin-1 receptor domain-containing protein [Candidatus Nitrospira neomarina]|uniref:Toll/interleukin-1 receptor domain-containing protein n=1 Tax=Candidatus Nitrospira neomarina TaxID=3020899 RepID=A0AA96GG28_9BACT|nr:toll/interleukin-1 receptor domain-containing protein [Candidatus Nitrospira neomarina]WNM60547.1 toll/interleukin-1 receptor domain-containing protein [Candidatus Nitrospira neomarina]
MMKVFLSHIAEEGPLAAAMKRALEEAIADFEVFVSGVDIKLGRAWLDALDRAFDNSSAVLVLCSPRSIARPWVNFESGGGWGRRVQVIPICHGGLIKKELPHPFSMFQALTLTRGAHGVEDLIRKLVGALACTLREGADISAIASTLSQVAEADRTLGEKVGIVRTAGQAHWPQGQYGSIFDLLHGRLPNLLGRAWPLDSSTILSNFGSIVFRISEDSLSVILGVLASNRTRSMRFGNSCLMEDESCCSASSWAIVTTTGTCQNSPATLESSL